MELPKLDPRQSARRSQGLGGKWLAIDELLQLEAFKQVKKSKLNTAMRVPPDGSEPEVKAAVRREIEAGEVICHAGEYGSTAFLLLEGAAVARVPERAEPKGIQGREASSLARLTRMFTRRSRLPNDRVQPADLGEVSRYGHWVSERPPPETVIRPGDLFGVDSCINFYPREATVQAVERCVAVEMLRCVLDILRDSRGGEDLVDNPYAEAAIRRELYGCGVLGELSSAELDSLARESTLVRNDSDEITDDVIYREGDPSNALYVVRSGTIKLSRSRQGSEVVVSYAGRGAVIGLENLLPSRPVTTLTLRSLSHRDQFPDVEITGSVVLGRKAGCTVRFPADHMEIGRIHCRLELRDGEVHLIDNDSVNHTLLNGEQIREALVAPADLLTLVDYHFEIIRTPAGETSVEVSVRTASATGLDNFEIVRVPTAAVRKVARGNPAFAGTAASLGRSLPGGPPPGPARAPGHVRDLVDLNLHNSQNTLLIDLECCTRCDECVRACATSHDGVARFTRDGPRFGKYLVTLACRSCTDPKCMVGCPVGSIRRKDSLEIHIEDWCVGCQRCADQCPFGNINMVELAAEKGREEEPARLRATVCDLCSGYDGPNCVYACPHDAAIRVNPSAFLSPLDK